MSKNNVVNLQVLCRAMQLCQMSYKKRWEDEWFGYESFDAALHTPQFIGSPGADVPMTLLKWFHDEEADAQAFLAEVAGDLFLSVRGTEFTNIDDWKTNLDCSWCDTPFGHSHNGFYQDAFALYSQIEEYLNSRPPVARQQSKLYINGHSQGAGVAKQLGLLFICGGLTFDACIGFGEPRSVDPAASIQLSNGYPDLFHRVVNNNDIVTRIPPRSMAFWHFGNLHYFFEDGKYSQEPSAWEIFLDRIRGHAGDFGEAGLDCLKDHAPAVYVKILEDAARDINNPIQDV